MKLIRKETKGITLVALVVTIIVLIILAGVSISLVLGENGIISRAKDASNLTKKDRAIEKVQLMLADYATEKYIGNKTLGQYLNEQKEQGLLEEVIDDNEKTITVEVDEYEITIKKDDLSIIEAIKSVGVKPNVEIIITKTNGEQILSAEDETLTQKALTINIKNIADFGENYTIEVHDSFGNLLSQETNVISGVTGQASYRINKGGTYTIKVTATKEGKTGETIRIENIKLAMLTIEDISMFNKENGVIDIIWLDTNNKVISSPISPKEHLGNLTAVKYNGSKWVQADENNGANDWYHYVAQTGNIDGKTSTWANAVANYTGKDDEKAYFVWIPRYAYKITYFETPEQAQAYRENGDTQGIVGYSNIEGMVKLEDGVEKLLKDSKPTNVTSKVQTAKYADYIPHPAFEFDGSKAGIWVGKFQSSGSPEAVRVISDVDILRSISLSDIFTSSLGVKDTYHLTGDTHMMKNVEWGAVAYLTESKYGRNGTKVEVNTNGYLTGAGDYKSAVLQSTTGNMNGIYDMSGPSWEYVTDVSDAFLKNDSNGCYYDFTNIDTKYYNCYSSYNDSKGIKGNAVYETSLDDDSTSSWHQEWSVLFSSDYPVLQRGRTL